MISLEAEVRCDHYISEEIKKLWAIQLDCLEQLKRICKKYDITYFAHGGTLLGAVRHQGFIPWDDDIDIFMLPQDYFRFCQVAEKELEEPYFFQHFTTQPEVGFALSRIRNSNTTGCTQFEYNRRAKTEDYNCGIFIDIFPLVYVPENRFWIWVHKRAIEFWRAAKTGRNYVKEKKKDGRFTWKDMRNPSVLLYAVLSLFMKDETFQQRAFCNGLGMFKSGKRVGMIPFYGYQEKCIWEKEYFNEVIELPFEDVMIPCPKEYDKVLRNQYGDYEIFQKGTAVHTMAVIDADTPYRIKFKDHYNNWLAIHERKVTNDTVNCYKAAYKYFSPLYYVEVSKIRTEHLQKCVDECPKGTRTKKNMKSLTTALWRYAIQNDIVNRNYAEFIYIPPEEKTEKTAFSPEQVNSMWNNVSKVPELKYVLILIYTGMRIGEMISALSEKYYENEQYFITGSKTKAGKDRIITISPRIFPFFKDFGKGEYLFFDNDKKMTEKYFRNNIYYSALAKIGLDTISADGTHFYNPHCCRHTFATMMKNIDAPATDKQKLIGHSKFEMTAYYTHTDIDSLKQITDKL